MINNGKQRLYEEVDVLHQKMIDINDFIHDHPELGNQEYQASALLTRTLAENGFQVESGIIGLDTAFTATYKNGEGGPVIGLLCEYDALEGLGHGCGHNLQAASITGAAIALSRHLGDYPVTLQVFGTPAEETTSAKLPMAQEGLFDHLDVALMMHGGDRTTVDGKSLALNLVDFVFDGKAAHAAVAPDQGISALDAVLMTFNGIEYLREHVRTDVRIHGVITDGGKAANVVPDRAVAQFYIRAADRTYLNAVVERVYNVARGAALATGAQLTINELKVLDNKINVPSLNAIMLDNAEQAGAQNITPPRQNTGSTDFSTVTYRVPGACLRVSFVPFGTSSHTKEWVEAGTSESGHAALSVAAKAVAGACYDLLADPQLFVQLKEEFRQAKAESTQPGSAAKIS
ncbi:M20 family metallopeptidase [Paenibacillus alginolyticus]|uniref:M20 family metallopeptidase n=1 Tax=Paenibacillus alginolyticus TaxID=59839 RepID=UPI00040CD432|nr:M20 family metallopeptidase [Paenibacillus alginolyticus]MCY9669978.1 M20 family metallopeptidase [Paenibacillus alginolyticus]